MHTTIQSILATVLAVAAASASAQNFPSKQITLIVPFAPGGTTDAVARIVGRELSAELKQPVVVENKPGAGGALGLMFVSRAPADGYTIGLGATGAIAINPNFPDAPPLKPKTDLAALGKLADIPLVLIASNTSGYDNLKAFLNKSKATPGGLTFGTSGQYTTQHLAGELLGAMSGTTLQAVPYRGGAPAVTDVLGGQLPAAVVDLTAAYPHIKAGKLVALGVTSATRSKIAPEIPTIAEEGVPGYSAPAWMGLFAPARTPVDVRTRLTQTLQTILVKPEVQAQITSLAAEPSFLDANSFSRFIDSESKKWASVIAKLPAPQK